jgi:type II secretory pathway pseudopilin PulG
MIEMMVVVTIMALIGALAMPSISSYFNVSLSSTGRQIAGTVKETYNATVITGQVHRMVYDLKEGTYWVESGPPTLMLDSEESRKRDEKKRHSSFNKKKDDSGSFQTDKSVTRKKISLPTGVSFEDIKTQKSPEPVTEGVAYTHFFPHGMIETTIIHLQDSSKHHVSLVINPIVGKTDMYERYITEKEAFSDGK